MADDLDACVAGRGLPGWEAKLPSWPAGEEIATRSACSDVLCAVLDVVPGIIAGGADLTGNTGTELTAGRTLELDLGGLVEMILDGALAAAGDENHLGDAGCDRTHRRRRLEPHAARGQLGVRAVEVVHHEGHVSVPRVARARVPAGALRHAVLQQLDVVARPAPRRSRQAQQRDPQLGVREGDDLPQIGLRAVPLRDQLEAEQVAIEGDRAVEVADGEPGVEDAGDAHGAAKMARPVAKVNRLTRLV